MWKKQARNMKKRKRTKKRNVPIRLCFRSILLSVQHNRSTIPPPPPLCAPPASSRTPPPPFLRTQTNSQHVPSSCSPPAKPPPKSVETNPPQNRFSCSQLRSRRTRHGLVRVPSTSVGESVALSRWCRVPRY